MKTLSPRLPLVLSVILAACSSSGGGGDNSDNSNSTVATSASVVLLAGDPGLTFGDVDANGNAARFFNIMDIASDPAGNVYVADTGNHGVRKITPAGAVSTVSLISNSATQPSDSVDAVALDGAGNLYVGDESCPANSVTPTVCSVGIHKFATNGAVTGIVPTQSSDGTGTVINGLLDMAVDTAGRLLIADVSVAGGKIRRLDPASGDLVTLLANVSANSIAVAKSGTVYYRSGGQVFKWVAGTSPVLLAGSPGGATGYLDGVGPNALLGAHGGIAVDDGEVVYVADTDSQTVRRVTSDGTVVTIAGSAFQDTFSPGPLPQHLDKPSSVAVSGTTLYVAMPSMVAIIQGKP